MRQVGFGGGARDVELRRFAAHVSRARGAPRGCVASCASNAARSVTATLRRPSGRARAARRRCAGPSSSCRSDAAIASRSSSRRASFRCEIVATRRRRAVSSSRGGFLEPLDIRRQRAGALDERGMRGLGFGGALRPAPASLRAPRTGGAARRSTVRRPSAARLDALRWNAVPLPGARPGRAAPPRARPALGRDLFLLPRTRSAASPALPTCSSKPTIDFSWRCSSPCKDDDGGLGGGDQPRRARTLRRAADRPRRVARRRARAAP